MHLYFTQMDPIPNAVSVPLEAKGWTCVHMPFREVVFLETGAVDFGDYDCIILTSKQAAHWLLQNAGDTLPPLAVVGGATTALLKKFHCLFKDNPPPSAQDLVERLAERGFSRRNLFLRGVHARDTVEKGLPHDQLQSLVVYDTQKIKKSKPIYGSGMVYFQAPSTVADFWETYRKPPKLIGVIGETTAGAIMARGWPVHFKAGRPELTFLAEQLPSPEDFNLNPIDIKKESI